MKKQKLIPLKVDWKVSSDGGFTIIMTDDDCDSELRFKAHYRRESILYEQAKGEQELTQKEIVWMNQNFYKLLIVTFPSGWCKFAPLNEISKEKIKANFDWGNIWGLSEQGDLVIFENYVEKFNKKWLQEKVCPDSGFYEVENSKWIEGIELGDKWKLNHYLIFGEHFYAEFLTTELNWANT